MRDKNGERIRIKFLEKERESILNACHTSEGRAYDYFKHRLNEAKNYFIMRGFDVKKCQSEVQEVLIAERT
jgi:hypothetical protein